MSLKWKKEILAINEMKRHYTNYFKGIPHFKEYRTKLVTSMDLAEVRATLDEIETKFEGVYQIMAD
jgi:tRNA-dihydrouridine synthase